jgi:hypothetical protein
MFRQVCILRIRDSQGKTLVEPFQAVKASSILTGTTRVSATCAALDTPFHPCGDVTINQNKNDVNKSIRYKELYISS